MRLASYNIRKAVGLDWRRDPARILAVLAEIDADIVVLQEADKRVGRRAGVLAKGNLARAGYRIADVALRPDSHGWHGNVILYRDALSLADTGRVELPALEPRGAVRAQFDRPGLGVIGVHLALTGSVRRRQMAVLGAHGAAARTPLIVAGDFNEWRNGDVPAGARAIIPGKSFHSARPVAALDRFLIFGPLRTGAARVHRSALAARASDHLPIVLDFDTE
ncbi:hypothetical protein BOO69_20870 (plasmid) [Sulfitobacter alexandrii]|uniref:Endonuclease/exonuclease/phosphatase domain-containing protein n=1 Tax=Sulfitobacter alexandrii TaxID=1917485 RepID=A0A1J0WNR3_9RHOB|nr:endonuclease/exonuclease/phosphatase family protein [Sulfitobacter alexandrii]APE46009.1 hypothetical protein BOO69_20870 [Sulfitobacter alexandrii]